MTNQSQYSDQHKFYESYAEAFEQCSNNGYQGDDVVAAVVEKNKILREQLIKNPTIDPAFIRVLVSLASIRNNHEIKVLDFGGGGGTHYTISKLALPSNFRISWAVVETSAMANKAKVLENEELKFFDNIENAVQALGKVDLVITSGTLHCCEKPLDFLARLLQIKAPRLFITRTAFNHENEVLIAIQKSRLSHNGPGPLPSGFIDRDVYYPNVFEPLSKVEEIIFLAGYSIRFRVIEEVGYQGKNGPIHMFGYLAELAC